MKTLTEFFGKRLPSIALYILTLSLVWHCLTTYRVLGAQLVEESIGHRQAPGGVVSCLIKFTAYELSTYTLAALTILQLFWHIRELCAATRRCCRSKKKEETEAQHPRLPHS